MLTVALFRSLRTLICARNVSMPVSSDVSCQAPQSLKNIFILPGVFEDPLFYLDIFLDKLILL